MTPQYLAALQQQAMAHHSGFIPNNHPSVSPHETNLFVAGLPPGTDDEKLGSYFTRFGKIVSARVLVDLVTHSLRNYGFVKFETRDAAERAIEEMNEYRVTPHQILHVTWATHREDAPECDTLYVRNLPDNVTRQDLTAFFSRWGEVRELSLPRCAPFRGVCFVRYRHVDEAKNALNDAHNATPFGNRALQVRYKAPSKKPMMMMGGGGGGGMGMGMNSPMGGGGVSIVNNSNGGVAPVSMIPPGATMLSAGPPPPGATVIATASHHHHPGLHHPHQQQILMMSPQGQQQQQQQLVQVVGPNGQIQLVPASAVILAAGSGSRNASSTSHPLMATANTATTNNTISPNSSMDHHLHLPQQQQQQQHLLVNPNNNNTNNISNAISFPAQGDLCFFNVMDDQELIRHLTASYGQVSLQRRTPEGALLIRLFNSQQHDFCARQLNGQSIAPGRPPLTVGIVGVQQ